MNLSELDPLVVPMVEYFNKNGLTTYMSCQGHNKTNMSLFWIQFDPSVTSEDIQAFMRNHLDWNGVFISCGRFAKRMFGFYGIKSRQWKTEESWNYFAATPDAAAEDLKKWTNPVDGWEGFEGEKFQKWFSYCKATGKI